jgi:hypothetical protein
MAYEDSRVGTARPVTVSASDRPSRILAAMQKAIPTSERASRILTISTFHPRRYVVRTGWIGEGAGSSSNGQSHE